MKSTKVKLTEAVVAKFKCPPDKVQAFLWDTEERGLGLRALPDYEKDGVRRPGAKTWVFQGRIAGTSTERRVKLGRVDDVWLNPRNAQDDEGDDPTRHSARGMARRMRRLMALGQDPQAVAVQSAAAVAAEGERAKAAAVTLRQVADHYIANKKTRNGPLKANTIGTSTSTWTGALPSGPSGLSLASRGRCARRVTLNWRGAGSPASGRHQPARHSRSSCCGR